MDISCFSVLLLMAMLLLTVMDLEAKAIPDSSDKGKLKCSAVDLSPFCTCQDISNGPTLICKVSTNQDFEGIRKQLSTATTAIYDMVHFDMGATLDIPENVLGGTKPRGLTLSCSDNSTPLGSIHVDAFRSANNSTEELEIQNCDLTKTSFSFLSQLPAMTLFEVTDSSIKEILDMPSLPRLKTIRFWENANFDTWYPASQTPNLEKISLKYMIDLNDNKMDSILSTMTKNFIYPKLNEIDIYENSLTRVPPLISIFPALTELDLSGNPIKTLPEGSVNKGSTQLRILDLSGTELTTIEPGAFVGDFSSTEINLSKNPMTSLPSSVFQDLLKSMVNSASASISIWPNKIAFDCNLNWLLVDNRDLLPKVDLGTITNGTRFEDLNTKELTNC